VTWAYTDESMRFVTRTLPGGSIESTFADSLSQAERSSIPAFQVNHALLWERAIAEMRRLRQPILDVLDGLQASANTTGPISRAQVIETAKQSLRDITKLDLSQCATFEEMGVVVLTAYASIVSVLPSDIKAAFKEVTE
jgi:hypothetical protein